MTSWIMVDEIDLLLLVGSQILLSITDSTFAMMKIKEKGQK